MGQGSRSWWGLEGRGWWGTECMGVKGWSGGVKGR